MPRNPLDQPGWPAPPHSATPSSVERYKQQLAEVAERRKEFPTADHESRVAIENAQIDLLKGAVERSRDGAKYIQIAASAIAGLYTGIAALVFNVSTKDNPLPIRGVLPVIFLGAAIVFATAYLTWLGTGATLRDFPVGIDAGRLRNERVNWFNDWVTLSVLLKAWTLRLATLFLAGGLVLLPAAFVPVSEHAVSADATETAVAQPPRWPEPPNGDPTLQRILYQAQVKETAEKRAKAPATKTASAQSGFTIDEWAIWLVAAGMTILFIGIVIYQQKWGSLGARQREIESVR